MEKSIKTVRKIKTALGGLMILTTALSGMSAPVLAGQGGLILSDPILRVIIVSRPAAGYFSLENTGATTRVLVGAASPVCKKAMLHQSKMINGVIKMLPINELPIKPGARLEFAPGGYHVMCMHPEKDIKSKTSVPLTLKFRNGDTLTGDFTVKGAR